MRGIADVVDNIGSVVELICAIAAQANPLSIDAMIEAPRANPYQPETNSARIEAIRAE